MRIAWASCAFVFVSSCAIQDRAFEPQVVRASAIELVNKNGVVTARLLAEESKNGGPSILLMDPEGNVGIALRSSWILRGLYVYGRESARHAGHVAVQVNPGGGEVLVTGQDTSSVWIQGDAPGEKSGALRVINPIN